MTDDVQINDAERYIQVNDFQPSTPAAGEAFWRKLSAHHDGYTVFFCYHDSPPPLVFLHSIGARLADDCRKTVLTLSALRPAICGDVLRVTHDNFDTFAALHDRLSPGMYWTSPRLRERLADWVILTRGEGYVMMSVWGDVAEIFACVPAAEADVRLLLSAAAQEAFACGKTSVVYMIDIAEAVQMTAARGIGFQQCGTYQGFEVIV